MQYIKKKNRTINNLSYHLKKLKKKQQQIKVKEQVRKEGIKVEFDRIQSKCDGSRTDSGW